jgi:hypothetical protein
LPTGRQRGNHLPTLDDGVVVGQRNQALHVLVDDQRGLPLLAQRVQTAPDVFADQRCQALGGFVQDQQVRVGHERAANGQHLLLAA